MIDIVVNHEGMLSIVHDDSRLDTIVGLEFNQKTNDIHVVLPGDKRLYLGRMSASLKELFAGKSGCLVRMDGWTIRETRELPVVTID